MWGARKMSGWGVSWTTSELSATTPITGRLQPRTRGNGAERWNKGRNIFQDQMDRCRESQGWTTACSRMPERDGKVQEEDSLLGCGSFVRGRKRKKVDSRPFIYYRGDYTRSKLHTGEASWDFSIHQYNLPSIPIIYIPNPFSI